LPWAESEEKPVDTLSDRLAWMAWTWQTMAFFGAVAFVLVIMTLLAIYRPETPRAGILRFATTRGDRLFVSLLASAFIFLGFIRFGGENFLFPVIASLLLAAIMFRFA
jgi:predicted small integral membrane protein